MTPWQFGVILKASDKKRESRWDESVWFMFHHAQLVKMAGKNFPKTMKDYLFKALRKKPVKGIDEGAIMARLKAYQKQRKDDQ